MSSSTVLVLQHGPLGPPGVLGDWLRDRDLRAEVHAAWEDPLPARLDGYVAVASLGSQYSAAAADPAWIADEVSLLRSAVTQDVPVLGLCFGGQALAVALGGDVAPAPFPEVGWMEVETEDPDVVPPGPWLQFHWEIFRPPPDAEILARTPAGPAAFRFGPHLGTQFHPEVTPEIVDGWAHAEPRLQQLDLSPGELRAEGERHAPRARENAYRLFDAWLAGVAVAGRR
jgi:GMP synthase-like glutamine amidotransferase